MQAEEEHSCQAGLQRQVFDSLSAHIAVVDPSGRITAVNSAWLRFAVANGVARESAVTEGANYLEVCRRAAADGDGGVEEALAGIESVLSGGGPQFTLDYPCHSPEAQRWFTMTVEPLRNGGIAGAVISHREVTAYKLAELALRESEERFRIVAENARGVIGIVQGKRFVYANPYLAEISGYSIGEILSMDFVDMVHPDFRQMVSDYARRRQLGEPAPTHYEFAMVTKCGKTRWMDFSPGLSHYRGRPAIVGTAFDVTERKDTESALRHSEERLRLAQRVGCVGVFDWDMRARRAVFTPELAEIFGVPEGSCGDDAYEKWMKLVHPEDLSRLRAELLAWADSDRETGTWEYRIVRRGEVRWLSGRGQIYRDPLGAPLRMLGTILDITERKEMELRLARSLQDLEKAQEELVRRERFAILGQMAGAVAHEIRTPLMVMQNTLQFLEEALPADGCICASLGEAKRAVDRSNYIISEMLDYARETKGMERDFAIAEAIANALQQVRIPDAVTRKESVCAGIRVRANPDQVTRILVNLIRNASEAMPDGGELSIRAGLGEGGKAWVQVHDTGCGIPETDRDKIFEPLFSTKVTGIGLGLAVARRYAQLNEGDLSVASRTGSGTAFTLTLKAAA